MIVHSNKIENKKKNTQEKLSERKKITFKLSEMYVLLTIDVANLSDQI